MRRIVVTAFTACLGAATWACTEAPTAAVLDVASRSMVGPIAASVTGSGHFEILPDGVWRTFSFAALEGADGSTSGTFHVRTHVPGGGAKVGGTVSCFTVVGNEAWVAGVITKAENPANVGVAVGWHVIDNGEGAGSPPDQTTRQWRQVDPAAYCADMPTSQELFDVEAGNIQIHR